MKEIGTTHWNNPNSGADNSSGFMKTKDILVSVDK
jgi:hypothetical protein